MQLEHKIALKACRHCAYTKNHFGKKEDISQTLMEMEITGKMLLCHEYTEPTYCASQCVKRGIKG